MPVLCEILPTLRKLKNLSLGKTGLNDGALHYLADIYVTHELPLRHLFLGCNRIDDAFIAAIIRIIKHSRDLIDCKDLAAA